MTTPTAPEPMSAPSPAQPTAHLADQRLDAATERWNRWVTTAPLVTILALGLLAITLSLTDADLVVAVAGVNVIGASLIGWTLAEAVRYLSAERRAFRDRRGVTL